MLQITEGRPSRSGRRQDLQRLAVDYRHRGDEELRPERRPMVPEPEGVAEGVYVQA